MDWVSNLCRRGPMIKHHSAMEKKHDFTEIHSKTPTDISRMRFHFECLWRWEHLPNASFVPACYQLCEKLASVPACPDLWLKASATFWTGFPNPSCPRSDWNSVGVWLRAFTCSLGEKTIGNPKVSRNLKWWEAELATLRKFLVSFVEQPAKGLFTRLLNNINHF